MDDSCQKTLLEVFMLPRRCMREPIQEIFDAAKLLERAVDAHLCQDHKTAEKLITEADRPEVREWTESLWGSKQDNPDQWHYLRNREVPGLGKPTKPKASGRMPGKRDKQIIIDRDGYNCRFCGIPVIPSEVRKALTAAYPDSAYWGSTNIDQHAALQCLWLQFDHIVPHRWGRENTPHNVVITCAPCNYGRMEWKLEEVGLIDPRTRPVYKTNWDGLTRLIDTN